MIDAQQETKNAFYLITLILYFSDPKQREFPRIFSKL